jgi:hypothetical protein
MELQKIGDLTVPAELEIREDKVFCLDCGRWEYVSKVEKGYKIAHSTRCDTPVQPKKEVPKPIKASDLKVAAKAHLKVAAKAHLRGQCIDPDVVLEAYQAGYLSMSDAMNSDY